MQKTKNIYDEKDVQKELGAINRDYKQYVKYYHREKYRVKRTGNRYDFNGLPDTILWLPHGKVITIEIKKEKEALSDNQVKWRQFLLNNDHDCYILRLEDTTYAGFLLCINIYKDLLRSYGVPVE